MTETLARFKRLFSPPVSGEGAAIAISSLTGSADAFLAAVLASQGNVVMAVTPGLPEADRLADDLKIVTAKTPIRILEFPPKLEGERSSLATRLKTIAALRARSINPYPAIVVASYPALAIPIPAGPIPSLTLSTDPETHGGKSIGLTALAAELARLGYHRTAAVEQEGDASVRGGIVDVWSPGEEFPVRSEFFGEELESLRTFDAATQRSIARINSAVFMPVENDETTTQQTDKPTNRRIDETLFSLLPVGSVVLSLEHNAYDLGSFDLSRFFSVFTGDPAPAGVGTFAFQTVPLPGFAELGADEAHHPELFDAARERLKRHLAAAEKRGDHILKCDDLSGGFELPGLVVVTKADRVFVKLKTVRTRRASSAGERINDFEELETGEYVVHVDYGVGRFIGSSEITVDGKKSEVFTVEYADGAKLHVPAAHAHLLSRYVGVKGVAVKLHRLDGKRWNKDLLEAQKAVADLAASLLETQARRETVPGFSYDVNCEGHDSFAAAFPYEETPDQLAAIRAVEQDLSAQKPMDRLICGDAGYGKTEVAMRAAYIAAMNGKQTAVLAPTTVLAEQHFETFTSRFDGTPVRIESVSRFQTSSTHKGTFKRIASGACDIVIGTHAILSEKIAFHDLGLIIVDEEQRFGVRHKEFLKHLRATADVLTLSATPIPRTLYLSMTGARDLSLLRTPPRERVAVEIKVARDSDMLVGAAIDAELARGGQIFFLHNRVANIDKIEKRLKEIRPQLRIVTAHGQMDATTLARKMRDFERGEYDLLLSTTIVESGIDIPRANTIIVNDAHMFGLADLYQLRGRVGRSTRQGRALFLLPPSGVIDSDARERLAALKKHGGLGAGFNLALRDLEIRGAGNLLGSQQSGHIATIGFNLYCQMLKRTVAKLKGEKVKDLVDVKLNLDFIELSPDSTDEECACALPYSYIEDDAQRMSFMKRFAEAVDKPAVKAITDELKDRFGPLPTAAKRLVKLAELRLACAAAKLDHLDVRNRRAVFYRGGGREIAFVCDLSEKTPDRKLRELIALTRDGAAGASGSADR